MKLTEHFFAGCGLVQCFKCCSYGHIAKHCRIEARCGHCSGSHETRSCTRKEFSFCACCKACGNKHTTHNAWSELCAARREVRSQLAWKLENRPGLFLTTVQPDAGDPVALRPDTIEKREPGRPSKIVQETEIGDGARGARRARQSTLSFATQEDVMEECVMVLIRGSVQYLLGSPSNPCSGF